MPDSTNRSEGPDVKSDMMDKLTAALEDVPTFFLRASEIHKKRLLALLEEWKHALRRLYSRRSCSIPIQFAVGDRAYTSIIKNIGAGGVFIETVNGVALGQEAILTFSLPTLPKASRIAGRIIWKNAAGFGVKFQATPYQEALFAKAIENL